MMSAVVQELEQCLLELPARRRRVVLPVVRPRDAPGVLSNWQLVRCSCGLAIGAALCIYLLVHGTGGHDAGGRRHGGRAPARADGVRPGRDERRERRRRAEGDRRQSRHLLADRDLRGRAEPRQGGRRARSRRGQDGAAAPDHASSRARRGSPPRSRPGRRRGSFPDVVSGLETVGDARAFRPDRGLAPVLPALDHEPRPALPLRPHHPGQRLAGT